MMLVTVACEPPSCWARLPQKFSAATTRTAPPPPRAPPEVLHRVPALVDAVLAAPLLPPLLHRRPLHLDRAPARTAHQMVVVLAAAAPPVELLAVGQAHLVDLTGVGQDL